MELRHLRYFLAICEAKSFSRAAERLHVTQPTLSHQIQQLEEQLGTRLLERRGNRTEPTAAGEVFRVHAAQALQDVAAGVMAVHELEGLIRGSLSVAVFHSFSNTRLPAVFADYASRYPGVRIVARQLSRHDMEKELLGGRLDCAIGYLEPADDAQIEAQTLFDEALVLVVGARHPWAGRRSIPMKRLAELSLVLLTPEFGARSYLDDYFASIGVTPHIVLEMNAIDPILATIRDTALATVLPQGAVGDTRRVRAVRLTEPVPRRRAAILWRRHGTRSAAATRLAEMLAAEYADQGKRKPPRAG
ncbi:transcriptional regulator CynR [Bordetella genomosp. 9]|uniref:Transcriptional regulator CynR n=1 Tax=Bordetella genomosp. 9 TaxID=1416803 RepID=A0A261R3J0_9BORD|nr:transcriptional regulator CynR [Bordetella genomosp. 9]OZI18893.1 transcriptional regulator CynR [Bordetella genomosp. 9]